MPQRITVYVVDYGRKYLQLQWVDPASGKRHTQSSKCTKRRDAERAAATLEEDLNSGTYGIDGSIPWQEFRDQFERQYLSGLATSTRLHVNSILNRLELSIRGDDKDSEKPHTLADVKASDLSNHVAWMRELGRSEDTIKNHLRHIRAAMQWAVDQRWLQQIPSIPRIRRGRKGKEMKGRPITVAEFRKMLEATPKTVTPERAASWQHLLRGLWLSGLRLRESLQLSWDGAGLRVTLTPRGRVRLRIPGDDQKSGEDLLYPVAPAFERFILKIPKEERRGFVFNPASSKGRQNSPYDVGRIIADIGRTAGVVVNRLSTVDGVQEKFASAHDLRRSFGSRWAVRVMPVILQKMMRHAHISTTMKYYVDHQVDEIERLMRRSDRKRRHNRKHNTEQNERRK